MGGCVSFLTTQYERKCTQEIILVYTIAAAIASVVASVLAYTSFITATDEFNGIIKNWETAPITGFAFPSVNSPTGCPNGYETLKLPKWPGTTSSACACGYGAFSTKANEAQTSTSTSTCDSNQTDAGCINQPSISGIQLSHWRGGSVCVERSGQPQLISRSKTRVVPTKKLSCEDQGSYKTCRASSDLTYASGRATCVKAEAGCPVTGLAFGSTGTVPEGYDSSTQMNVADGSGAYFTKEQTAGVMPLNELEFAFYDPSSEGKRGVCFQDLTSQQEYGSAGDSYDYENNYPSECSGRVDKRWEAKDEVAEANVLKATFDALEDCTSSSTVVADYLSTGTRCSSTSNYFSDPSCAVYRTTSDSAFSTNSQGCASGATVCENIVYQSACGQLQRWALHETSTWPSTGGAKEFALMGRHEIYWKPDCHVTMVKIKSVQRSVNHAKPGLLANMIVNILTNILIGIVFPGLLILNLCYDDVSCIPGEGEAEKALINKYKKYGGVLFHFIKLMPALAALATLGEAGGVLGQAAESGCGASEDTRTEETFKVMHSNLSESRDALVSQVTMDIANLLMVLCMAIVAHLSRHEEKKAVTEQELHDRIEADLASAKEPPEAADEKGEAEL